ncbi:MAG: hypothetical protein A2X35_11625 [Elusimicrobia bacterium GWA2_61_42]|nr:MAG: hypothetical protein A2X35_11625 [Elusimicrobia bacterium GWA2_61_42]OGR75815.1 MAG: hypothetical protein A2X38_07290 [Elusimicrobia bacterium GWC2_61_25]
MIWKIFARLPSKWNDAEDYARECYQAGIIAIGWNKLGDLNATESFAELRGKLKEGWGGEAESGAKTIGQWAGTLWSFRNKVKAGDYVICPDSDSGRYYVGIINSDSVFYDETTLGGKCNFAHRRKVKWVRVLNLGEIQSIWPGGRFGGNQTLSEVEKGAERFMKFLKKKRSAFVPRSRVSSHPDMEWGKEAEARAMVWLGERGYQPTNVAHLNVGWDITCGNSRFEVKGRKSPRSAVRLSQNEWRAAKKFKREYTVLIFTAPTKEALQMTTPMQIPDPTRTESWTPRVMYEYILAE